MWQQVGLGGGGGKWELDDYLEDSEFLLCETPDRPFIQRFQDFPPLAAFGMSDDWWSERQERMVIAGSFAASYKRRVKKIGRAHV